MEEFVSLYRHLKSGAHYIFIEELGERLRLVDQAGAFVVMPAMLFDEEPVVINLIQETLDLGPSQIGTYRKYSADQAAQHQRAEQAAKMAKREVQRVAEAPRPRAKPQPSLLSQRTGVAAVWSGAVLCFYRPQIDRLGPKQSFKVSVDGVGDFVMTKNDFLSSFSDVILSPKYKQDGYFAYPEIPEKARRFMQS